MGETGSARSQLSATLTTPKTSQTTRVPSRPSWTAKSPLARPEANRPPPTPNLSLGIPNNLSGTLKTTPVTPKTPWAPLCSPRPTIPSRDPHIHSKDALGASRAPKGPQGVPKALPDTPPPSPAALGAAASRLPLLPLPIGCRVRPSPPLTNQRPSSERWGETKPGRGRWSG